ncbi:3,4-dihydroxyphenylacetate 2,3-dioxygenase [Hydrogenibacillus schlegelii]|uniref:3,4-dihydroxyphenylacetate 2,3-dioxygenase n=1 Tax=Hydrogenibacillus schlegelii TaxID=1484 RepID=A0A132MGW2_HYDSH|nr:MULTISPECIES: 3,4-dihydroxyphenylacetate 2,3-dioxygenase [Hydrogenibacillus]KWW97005.1 3,4-dihydroxyphenylacetate 2,3-dioxygenase [Hydrogenibacillus schlegelii]MBT9281363.1 3,4-dihydroxyphenylacetate 2,3-dioxygenase [Hydrogenibacillus schlegelii]OAR05205.1 3,4-dihydroxyphenylacetate 2,3-dioxygenase [Hydrogenibacillus schlegelii]PTQ50999.1 MAG: 3,4-dihydroxyphenylacetate 2,3-dioxygenase [Hydrogenibacillus schlegelii]QZA33841.1 3,4-dihydroxyphenylacetate 2,3-dioxygenase [Hydrogenibacillus sp.
MILRLGYAELYVTDLERARAFYVEVLGFIEAERTENRLYLRGVEEFDRYSLILTRRDTPGLGHFGLRVASPEALSTLEKLHAALGVPLRRVPEGTLPGMGEALWVREPNGHPVAFYHEMDQVHSFSIASSEDALPMRRTHLFRGIPPLRIDHMNLRVADVDAALQYWRDRLAFSVSEYVVKDGATFAAWTRRAPGTHDVALVRAKGPALHHVAYLVQGPQEIIRTADLLADAGYQASIEFGPGRHGLSNALFLYIRDPDGNRIEIYANDYPRDLDRPPIRWTWEEYDRRGRLWWGPEYPARFLETQPVNDRWPG